MDPTVYYSYQNSTEEPRIADMHIMHISACMCVFLDIFSDLHGCPPYLILEPNQLALL